MLDKNNLNNPTNQPSGDINNTNNNDINYTKDTGSLDNIKNNVKNKNSAFNAEYDQARRNESDISQEQRLIMAVRNARKRKKQSQPLSNDHFIAYGFRVCTYRLFCLYGGR